MANPRQKRKMRSGTAKVKTSKQSIKNKNKVIVKGPALLAQAWDKKKTVRQNYAALGLLHSSNPRQAGGLEPNKHTPYAVSSATPATVEDLEAALDEELASGDEDADEQPKASTSAAAAKPKREEKLRPGMARIIRDEKGNIVSIVMGDENGGEVEEKLKAPQRGGEDSEDEGSDDGEDEEEEEEEEPSPWGAPMKDFSVTKAEKAPMMEEEDEDMAVVRPTKTKQGIPIGGGVRRVAAKSDVVRQLEQQASFTTKVVRHTSAFERDWLVSLVAKYGDDISKMARDRKANVWQKTPGELKRMIAKAGGVEKLQAQAAAASSA